MERKIEEKLPIGRLSCCLVKGGAYV